MKIPFHSARGTVLAAILLAASGLFLPTAKIHAAAEPADRNRTLEQALNQKLDVDYWRMYLSDVLDDVEIRTGVRALFPPAANKTFLFALQQKDITVRQILEKLASNGNLTLEYRDGHPFFWKHEKDEVLANLGKKLKDSDRWTRSEAAFELALLGDPRIYPLLFGALQDKDERVVKWVTDGFMQHTSVVPYLDRSGREALSGVLQARLFSPDGKSLKADPRDTVLYGRLGEIFLFGATNTDRSFELLTGLLNAKEKGDPFSAVYGLQYSNDPRTLEALLSVIKKFPGKEEEEQQAAYWESFLCGALARFDDPRVLEILLQKAKAPAPQTPPAPNGTSVQFGGAWGMESLPNDPAKIFPILSRLHDSKAVDAVTGMIQDEALLKNLAPRMRFLSARQPRISDALAARLNHADEAVRNLAIDSLARAGDYRALDALIYRARTNDPVSAQDLWLLCEIRDSRAEEALIKFQNGELKPFPDAKKPSFAYFGQTNNARDKARMLLMTRDPQVAGTLLAAIKDPKSDVKTRVDAAMTFCRPIPDRICVSELNQIILNADLAFTKEFLVQSSSGMGSSYYYRFVENFGNPLQSLFEGMIFASNEAWIARLVEFAHEPFERASPQNGTISTGAMSYSQDKEGRYSLLKGNPAIASLAAIPAPMARKALLKALSDEADDVRETAILSLPQEMRSDPDVIEAVAARLNDSNRAVKEKAVEILGDRGDARVLEALRATVREKAPRKNPPFDWQGQENRWNAARMLLQISDESAPGLIQELAADQEALYSDSCISQLAHVDSPMTPKVLRALMKNTALRSDVRADAAMGLKDFLKDPEAMEILTGVLKAAQPPVEQPKASAIDYNIRNKIVRCISQAKDPSVAETLIQIIRDNGVPLQVRATIIHSAVSADQDAAIKQKYMTLVDDETVPLAVRANAAVAMSGGSYYGQQARKKPADPVIVKALIAFWGNKDLPADARANVCSALIRSGDDGAYKVVAESLQDADLSKRLTAACQLCDVKHDGQAIECLLQIVKSDADKQTRQRAHNSLQWATQNNEVTAELKEKIRATFEECNKKAQQAVKPPPAPDADF